MKNLFLILAFVLNQFNRVSQTIIIDNPGTTQQFYTVSIPQGHGYNYFMGHLCNKF